MVYCFVFGAVSSDRVLQVITGNTTLAQDQYRWRRR